MDTEFIFMLVIFSMTVMLVMWRPIGMNEAVPSFISALIIIFFGIVSFSNVVEIFGIVLGASITILSTIVMSIVLESIGFFRWAAYNLLKKSNGSGRTLYWYTNLLCFVMTLFMNNDGSILITTPIIIHIVTILKLKRYQKVPYLLSGAIIATASSAPIGVSNLANLIALKIVGLDLNSYAKLMFVPSMLGILVISLLLYYYFKRDIPKKITVYHHISPPVSMDYETKRRKSGYTFHPLIHAQQQQKSIDWPLFCTCIAIVVLVRMSLFIFPPLGIPMEFISIAGACALIFIRWRKKKKGIIDIAVKTPWHIFIFAFSMYVIVYGFKNIGFTSILVNSLYGIVSENLLNASLSMGVIITVMSNLFNNLPSVMLGTLIIVDMGLDSQTMQVAYLANVIGSDIGALLTPMGTLATLIWMYILRKNGIFLSWGNYVKTVVMVVPIGLIVSLLSLYFWAQWVIFS